MTLRLKPESLGDLRIKLELDQATISARFEAATPEARRLLEQSMDSLRSALEARGLTVERLQVHGSRDSEPGAGPFSQGQGRDGVTDDPSGRSPGQDGDRGGGTAHGGAPDEDDGGAAIVLPWERGTPSTGSWTAERGPRIDAIA